MTTPLVDAAFRRFCHTLFLVTCFSSHLQGVSRIVNLIFIIVLPCYPPSVSIYLKGFLYRKIEDLFHMRKYEGQGFNGKKFFFFYKRGINVDFNLIFSRLFRIFRLFQVSRAPLRHSHWAPLGATSHRILALSQLFLVKLLSCSSPIKYKGPCSLPLPPVGVGRAWKVPPVYLCFVFFTKINHKIRC